MNLIIWYELDQIKKINLIIQPIYYQILIGSIQI